MAIATVYHLGFAGSLSNERVGIKRFKTLEGQTDHQILNRLFEHDNMPEEFWQEAFDDLDIPRPVTLTKRTGRCYSLSVGDVVRVGNGYYVCLPSGWGSVPRFLVKMKVRAWFKRSRPRSFFQDWAGFLYKTATGKQPASFEAAAGAA